MFIIYILLLFIAIVLIIVKKKNLLSKNIPIINNKLIIDKIFIINLDRSPKRLEFMEKQCNNNNIVFERFPGIDGSKLNISELLKNNLLKDKKIIKGALGCSLSHINLWKKIKNSSYNNILILEDDCLIESNFWKKFNQYSYQIPKDYDILYLGGSNIYGNKISKNILSPVIKTRNSDQTENTGTYAMIINIKAINSLLKNITPIDDYIDQVNKKKKKNLNKYYIIPPLVKHNNQIDSDRRIISNKSGLTSWFKKIQPKITILN